MLKNLDEYERRGAMLALLVALITLLLMFVLGLKYMDPPDEYGVVLDFGGAASSAASSSSSQPVKEEVVEEEIVEETQPVEEAPADAAAENVLTQESEEAIAMKKAEQERKAKEAAEARERAKEKARQEKIRKEQEAKKKKLDALINGVGNSKGNDNDSGNGNSNSGNDGNGNGNDGLSGSGAYGNSTYGNGSGDSGKGWGLQGRSAVSKKKHQPQCNEEGKVVVEIVVDKNGKVVKATPGKRGTIADSCLYDAARRTALSYKFNAASDAPDKQIGFVVVQFTLGQ